MKSDAFHSFGSRRGQWPAFPTRAFKKAAALGIGASALGGFLTSIEAARAGRLAGGFFLVDLTR